MDGLESTMECISARCNNPSSVANGHNGWCPLVSCVLPLPQNASNTWAARVTHLQHAVVEWDF
eukprot:5827707-Amphidinium_carterae.1